VTAVHTHFKGAPAARQIGIAVRIQGPGDGVPVRVRGAQPLVERLPGGPLATGQAAHPVQPAVQFHNFLAHLFAAERLDAKVTSAALSVRNRPAVFHVMSSWAA